MKRINFLLPVATFVLGFLLPALPGAQKQQELLRLREQNAALQDRLRNSMSVEEATQQKLADQIRDLQNQLWAAKGALNAFRLQDPPPQPGRFGVAAVGQNDLRTLEDPSGSLGDFPGRPYALLAAA